MKKNNKGLSLVGVMIAIGVMGVVALGIAQLSQNMGKIKQDTYAVMDEMNLEQTVRSRFFNKIDDGNPATPDNGCTATFNQTYSRLMNDDDTQPDILNPSEGVQSDLFLLNAAGTGRGDQLLSYQPGNNKFGIITIDDIRLFFPQPDSANPQEFTAGRHAAQLNVYVSKKYGQQANGNPFIKRKIIKFPMSVEIEFNGGWRIADCNSAGMTDVDTSSLDPDAPASNERACQMAGKFYDVNQNPPCQLSLVGVNMLAPMGGTGGESKATLRCPPGMGAVGIGGREDQEVDALYLVCKEIDYNTLTPIGADYHTAQAGGNGGNVFGPLYCPPGRFITGMQGRADARVDRLIVTCSYYDGTNATQIVPGPGGNGGNIIPLTRCAANTILREIQTKSGTLMDRVRGVCW